MDQQQPANYNWVKHEAARLKFEVPGDWVTTQHDEKTIKVRSPDGVSVEFRFFTTGSAEAMRDEKFLTKELESMVKDVKFTNPPTKFHQHGLAGFGAGGSGHLEETPIAWFSIAIGDQHGHGVVAFGFGPQRPWMVQVKAIERLMASVQPAA
jgi:hypothetical protein